MDICCHSRWLYPNLREISYIIHHSTEKKTTMVVQKLRILRLPFPHVQLVFEWSSQAARSADRRLVALPPHWLQDCKAYKTTLRKSESARFSYLFIVKMLRYLAAIASPKSLAICAYQVALFQVAQTCSTFNFYDYYLGQMCLTALTDQLQKRTNFRQNTLPSWVSLEPRRCPSGGFRVSLVAF